ncbi:MAG: DUF3108 domain-containing protein [Bacteroidales bacterium]|nr:DUF3108 domain-containing protein [Bacteroidales bacterium]
MKKLVIIFSFSLFVTAIQGQCNFIQGVFGDGEEISYTVSYNWGPVWVDAGLVKFSVTNEVYKNKDVWHLKASGKTFTSYDLFFKVHDYYDSWVDRTTFTPIDFKRHIFEGGYTLLNTLNFEPQNKRVISNTKTNDNPQRKDTFSIKYCSFDMLSAIYYVRSLDFSNIQKDIIKNIPVLIDDGYYGIIVRTIGKETVENTDGKKYRCIKFAAKMVQGTIFRGDEDVLVWVTDDDNRIPIYIEAKILVGTIKAYLREAKGVSHPMTSMVK